MHAGLLDMFHDAADNDIGSITDGIDVHLDRIVEKMVKQYRRIIRYLHRFPHVTPQIVLVINDFHGPPAEHVRRSHHERVTDFLGALHGLVVTAGRPVGRLFQLQTLHQFLEAFAVFGQVNRIR